MSDQLDAMARGLRDDPFFLAAALDEYARSEGLDGTGMAGLLGCGPATLGPLGLCRRPDSASPRFWTDVEAIASRFGVAPDTLAEVLRRAEALTALRAGSPANGFLAAARDRDHLEPHRFHRGDDTS